jgi:hypothetical protein
MPIFDYIKIAEELYTPDNISIEKNKEPEIFDVFEGHVNEENNGNSKYRMVLYKNTKIVHTLFPKSDKHNKKKYIDFRRGKANGMIDEKFCKIAIPYFDHQNIVIFSFQVIREFNENLETGLLVDHRNDKIKIYNLYERPFNFKDIKDIAVELDMFEIVDLSKAEKIIKEILYKNAD